MNKDELLRELEIERAKPSPPSRRPDQYGRLMGQLKHYAEGIGINWPLFSDGLDALKKRFETENAIVALERFFLELEQEGLTLLAKRRRR